MFTTSRIAIAASLLLIATSAVHAQDSNESPPAADPSAPYRVMSFNIRYGTADDGPNEWPARKELVAETIRRFSPDLLGTQETLPFQADYLQQQLDGYSYVGKLREPDQDTGEQCGILFRTARFVDLEQGHFWLSKTPDVPASRGWDTSLPRMVTWVKLFDRQNQRTVYFFNTHFDHQGSEARREGAKVLLRRLIPLNDHPVIVTGDFNCGEGSQPYGNLVTGNRWAPLQDTLRTFQPTAQDGEGTFNGFRGRDNGPRIDWILASPAFHVESAEVVKFNRDQRYPSDHFPVTAVLRLK